MKCEEAQELITALIDHELSDGQRASVDGHLRECARCRLVHGHEQALKRELRAAAASITAPNDLRQRILSSLKIFPGIEQAPQGWQQMGWWLRLALRPVFIFALLFLLVLPAVYLMLPKEPLIPQFVLQSHSKILEGRLAYAREKNPERLKEKLLRSVGGRFAPMGYDLSMVGLEPVGGTVQEIGGRKILVTLYEGKAPSITCYTFLGTDNDIPKEAKLFEDPEKKISFYTFYRDGVNGVLHREGEVICIFVSRLPIGELLALARSKAQPPAPL